MGDSLVKLGQSLNDSFQKDEVKVLSNGRNVLRKTKTKGKQSGKVKGGVRDGQSIGGLGKMFDFNFNVQKNKELSTDNRRNVLIKEKSWEKSKNKEKNRR